MSTNPVAQNQLIERIKHQSGATVTIERITYQSGATGYYARAERLDPEDYQLLWADWFLSLARARDAIGRLDL